MQWEKTKDVVNQETGWRPSSLWDMAKLWDEKLMGISPVRLPLRSPSPKSVSLRDAAADICPAVDIFEENGNIVITAELPGIRKEDIDVRLTDGAISISGEKNIEDEVKLKDYYKWERSYGFFCRTFMLPAEIQRDKVNSVFKDGVLKIVIPRSEEAKSKEVRVTIQ
ncbi:MAG: Hsp20/alpha crystallin family protein [Syntrophales bacterium]|nr:Hsp20/alpha crystallin family protein [Syntrophales bacterium]